MHFVVDTPMEEEGFQEVKVRSRREVNSDFALHPEGSSQDAMVVLTSNGFEVLGIFDGEPTANNLALEALPHQSND